MRAIGRDCVGALQFLPVDEDGNLTTAVEGEIVDEGAIETLLRNLVQAPLGLNRDDDFRISVAGAQDKTALLWHDGKWLKPHGATPTTHMLKVQIGKLPNGIDMSNSVENEFYCLKLLEAFGLPAAAARIETFGETKALVVERFDRRWTRDGRLLRLPQEDCCQALSVPPTRKYQSDGGPGIKAILNLLKASDAPERDQSAFMKAQLLFWLIGATDGHAKNFSIFLGPGGSFRLTPLYDVLSALPSLAAGQIQRRQMKLAMSVGNNNHYRIDEISPRHFIESGDAAKISKQIVTRAIDEIAGGAETAIAALESRLPRDFPEEIHASVKAAFLGRSRLFAMKDVE